VAAQSSTSRASAERRLLRQRPHLRRNGKLTPSRRSPQTGSCSGKPEADAQQARGHRHDAPASTANTVLISNDPRQHLDFYKGGAEGNRSGRWMLRRPARRRGSSTRSPTCAQAVGGNTRGEQRRRPLVTRRRRQPRGASSSRSPTRRRSTATKEIPERVQTVRPQRSTNNTTRSSALGGQTGKRIWSGRPSRTTSATTLQIPAILTTSPIKGVQTEVVCLGGREDGPRLRLRRGERKALWTRLRSASTETTPTGPRPRKPVTIFRG